MKTKQHLQANRPSWVAPALCILFSGAAFWEGNGAVEGASPTVLPGIALGGGILICLLIIVLFLVETNRRALAGKLRESENHLRQLADQSRDDLADRGNVEAELAYERNLLRTLLRNIPDRVYFKDAQSRFLQCSTEVALRLGFDNPDLAVGRTDLDCFTKDYARALREQEQRIMETGEPVIGAIEKETWKNGEITWTLATRMPLRDKDGKIIGTFGASKDISAIKRSEEALIKAGKLESIGFLAGGIAHDFNNVLTAITGNLSLTRHFPNSMSDVLACVRRAEQAAARAQELSAQLLTFASGGDPIRKTLRLPAVLEKLARVPLDGTGVKCRVFASDLLWPVSADESQLNLVFNHLLANARDAMPLGGLFELRAENVELAAGEIEALPAGRYVRINARDTGVGIKPELLPKIFDPYFTTRKQATGMGLAIAHSIVRKHDGDIRVESALGKGTSFQILLPAAMAVDETLTLSATHPPVSGARILVMDDEHDLRTVASIMLELMGYDVALTSDGAECIEQYVHARKAGRPFDGVILDLTVPNGMGGKETIGLLREIDPEVRAIVCSGYSYDPVMANHRDYGFSGAVPKPYNMEQMRSALRDLLARRELAG